MLLSRLLCLLAATIATTLSAQDLPGLKVTFTSAGKTDVRSERLLALYVPAGQAPTPFLTAGPFMAKWEGDLQSPLRGTFKLSAESSGKFKLSLNGQPLLDGPGNKTVQLNKGANRIVAEITSADKGDTFVRLSWASKDFPLEPVPPALLTHPADKELDSATQRREGRLLFAQMNCAACHADPALLPTKGTGMPEHGQIAPLLSELGTKFKKDFLVDWIRDPHSIRPHSLMPKVFTGADANQKSADLAAMLTQGATPKVGAIDLKLAPQGGALFANLGCVACHQRPDAEGKDTQDRVPLGHVNDKWHAAALVEYLQDPAKHYPATRMPHFRLEEEEATQLAAYLLANSRIIKRKALAGDATRGATLLVSAGCLNCHAGMPATTQPTLATVLKAGDKGAPSFTVWAMKEPDGANLDRIQIVKGWMDAKGALREKVYDVAWSDADKRKPGADGKLPGVGSTVDLATATWTNTIGDPELIAVWRDPEFDPKQRAFYYARVLEIPTPRWTLFDAVRYKVAPPKGVPLVTQERIYSSPIWYEPKG